MKMLRRPAAFVLALLALPDVVHSRQVLRLHYDPRDRETGRYQYVPLDVPEGTSRLQVSYAYDRLDGQNVVDLGLFEPGPLELGLARARGWTGGERSEVTVATGSATPGYWPGPLPAGRWHVQLGLYKVAPAGVDIELTFETGSEPQPSPAPVPPPRREPLRSGPAWYRGDLHTHTVHSDGKLTVAELVQAARDAGLEFIAITDHNNTAHQADGVRDDALLTIVGEEVTTPGGHANVWGLGPRDFVDFRVLPGEGQIGALVRSVVARGAVFSINHPFADCAQCSWDHSVPEGVTGIEIWNRWDGPQEPAITLWDRLLKTGRRLTGVGSSDFHRRPQPLGRGSVRVWAPELSTPAILNAIRKGRVIVMGDGTTPPPLVTLRAGDRTAEVGDTLAIRKGGTLVVEVSAAAWAGGRADVVWSGEKVGSLALGRDLGGFEYKAPGDGYVRVEVRGPDGAVAALTNPVFVTTGGP
jgi:PHP domain